MLLCVNNDLLRNSPDFDLPLLTLALARFEHGLMILNILFEVVKGKELFIKTNHDVLHVFVFSIKLEDRVL